MHRVVHLGLANEKPSKIFVEPPDCTFVFRCSFRHLLELGRALCLGIALLPCSRELVREASHFLLELLHASAGLGRGRSSLTLELVQPVLGVLSTLFPRVE